MLYSLQRKGELTVKNVTIYPEKGFVDHRGLAFPDRGMEANRIVQCSDDSGNDYLGFLPFCDALLDTVSPDEVTPDLYSVIIPREAFDRVWNDNQDTDHGTEIATVDIAGDPVKLIRDDGNGKYAASWRIEVDGESVAYFDHEAIGMLRREESFSADQEHQFGGDIDELLRMLMGGQSETE